MTDIVEFNKTTGKVYKNDSYRQIVGGFFSVFKIFDSDNETIDITSYVDKAMNFVKYSREANFNHEQGEAERGTLIDSVIIDSEEFAKYLVNEITGIPIDEIPVKKIGHFGSFEIHDKEDFDSIIAGDSMFSIEGLADRVLIEDEE